MYVRTIRTTNVALFASLTHLVLHVKYALLYFTFYCSYPTYMYRNTLYITHYNYRTSVKCNYILCEQ